MAGSVIVFEATASVISASTSFSFFSKLIDTFTSKAEIEFEVKGENYEYRRKLFFLKEEYGSSIKLVIRGKPLAVKYILEKLTGIDKSVNDEEFEKEIQIDDKTIIKKIKEKVNDLNQTLPIVPEKMHVNKWSFIRDIFSSNTIFEFYLTGKDYYRNTQFLYHVERGSKMKIRVSGRPQFTKAIVDHISLFGPRLENLFKTT